MPVGVYLDIRWPHATLHPQAFLSGPRGDRRRVGSFLHEHQCSLVESAQFGDQAQRFFMRVCFDSAQARPAGALQAAFAPIGEKFSMQWDFYDLANKQRQEQQLLDCAAAGRDVECAVLARAVKWHVEHRILVNGNRAVVFR